MGCFTRFGLDVGAGKTEQPAVKCLEERRGKGSDRSQAANGSAIPLRFLVPERAGAERCERRGERDAVAAWSARWFRQ